MEFPCKSIFYDNTKLYLIFIFPAKLNDEYGLEENVGGIFE